MFHPIMSHPTKSYRRYFDGEGNQQQSGNQGTPPAATGSAVPPASRSFSQDEVNTLLAKNKREVQDQNRQLVADLTKLKDSQTLTEQQNQELEQRIQQLTATYQTEAETKAIEMKKLEKKAQEVQETLSKDRDSWRTRYERKMVEVEVASASVAHGAYSPEQISAILAPSTKVVESLGEDHKPTGEFETKVEFVGEDKDGKPIKLTLSVVDAVKTMKTMAKYANLFKAEGAGGIGGHPNGGSINGTRPLNLENMSLQDYTKRRNEIRQQMANTRG